MKMTFIFTGIISTILCYGCQEPLELAVGFTIGDQHVVEADSIFSVQIDLGHAVAGTTTLQLELLGTAGLDADFSVPLNYFRKNLPNGVSIVSTYETSTTTSATLTWQVTPGSRYVTIPLRVVDDAFVEPDAEFIRLSIADVSNSTEVIKLENVSLMFYLQDNDLPAAPVQIDLSWIPIAGGSVNQSDFDLFLVRNTKPGGGSVASYEFVEGVASTHVQGYESILLKNDLPDDEYFVLIKFTAGTAASHIELVLSQNQTRTRAGGTVSTVDVGKSFFYGPISKNGSSISFRAANPEATWLNLD